MARRIFTPRDVAPLVQATDRILEQEPDAAVVAAAATPFKRRIPKAAHEERIAVRLPVEVETSANPDGVPLHAIAEAVRRESPGVTGVSLTPGGLSLKFARPPTAAQRRQIDALLADRTRLERLKPGLRVEGVMAEPPPVPDEQELRRVLRDPGTTDTAWLRAFRAYAAANLIAPPGEPGDRPGRRPEG